MGYLYKIKMFFCLKVPGLKTFFIIFHLEAEVVTKIDKFRYVLKIFFFSVSKIDLINHKNDFIVRNWIRRTNFTVDIH